MKNKILILGGSHFQIPVIQYAKSAGYYVITCDYLPDNPGHKYADEYHNVSTTDMEAVLDLACRLRIDGILAYASDPAAPTAAYVGNRLELPSNPYESVRILTNKDLYREFLRRHGFHAPRAISMGSGDLCPACLSEFQFPVMVKPVDSSGSKGVSKIDTPDGLAAGLAYALQFSRIKRVIVEEYVFREGPQIGGEAFVLDGKLVFMGLGDQFNDAQCNPFVPVGMTFPSHIAEDLFVQIESELQRLLDLLGYSFGGLNLEIMVDASGRIFLMEIGPRTGGNFLPELMQYFAGMKIAQHSVESSFGHRVAEPFPDSIRKRKTTCCAYYSIHSKATGILQSLAIDPDLGPNILEQYIFKARGDRVNAYHGADCTLGILLLQFESAKTMQTIMAKMDTFITLEAL